MVKQTYFNIIFRTLGFSVSTNFLYFNSFLFYLCIHSFRDRILSFGGWSKHIEE
jgi:hypothetical protein